MLGGKGRHWIKIDAKSRRVHIVDVPRDPPILQPLEAPSTDVMHHLNAGYLRRGQSDRQVPHHHTIWRRKVEQHFIMMPSCSV